MSTAPDREAMKPERTPTSARRRTSSRRGARLARRLPVALPIAFLCLAVLAGCDELLEVESDPELVDATKRTTLQETMVGAAVDLYRAVDEKVSYAGLFGDEFVSASTGPQHRQVDARQVTSTDQSGAGGDSRGRHLGGGFYIPLQRLVAVAHLGQERILAGEFEELPDGSRDDAEYARLAFYKGLAKLYLADLYCTVALLGTGPEFTTAQVYEQAEADLTEAIQASDVEDDVRQAALVLRARVRLIRGNDAGALADAQAVDAGFEFFVGYSTATFEQRNRISVHTFDVSDWSIAPRFRDLTIDDTGIPDPRTELIGPFDAFDPSQAGYGPVKNQAPASPIRIASGDEAQYIIAEVQGGPAAVDIINQVRARHGIDQVWAPGGGDPDEVRDKLIDERFRTLFLEGVHLGDLRRYIDKFDLNLFPTSTPQGEPVGTQTCLPMPAIERDNNPDL